MPRCRLIAVDFSLLFLCFAVGVAMCAQFIAITLVPLVSMEQGLTPAAIGALASMSYVAPLIVAMPLGRLLDRGGATALVRIGAASMTLLLLLAASGPTLPILVVLQAGIGLTHIVIILSGQTIAAALGPTEGRLRRFGWFTTAVSVGQMLGPSIAGLSSELLGFPVTFAMAGIFAALSLVGLLLLPTQHGGVLPTWPRKHIQPVTVRGLWLRPGVRFAMLISSSVLVIVAVQYAFLPVLLTDAGVSPRTIGLALSLLSLASVSVRPLVHIVYKKMRESKVAVVSWAFFGVLGTAMIGFDQSLVVVCSGVVLIGVATGFIQPLSLTFVLDEVHSHERGLALGFRLAGNRLVQLITPVMVGVVAVYAGVAATLVAVAVLVALVLALLRWQHTRVTSSLPPYP